MCTSLPKHVNRAIAWGLVPLSKIVDRAALGGTSSGKAMLVLDRLPARAGLRLGQYIQSTSPFLDTLQDYQGDTNYEQ